MFLRFSKGAYVGTKRYGMQGTTRMYRKSVFLGNEVVMEYGNDIVGVATMIDENERTISYRIWVATQNELSAASIARGIKDLIGKSNKFSATPSTKRRKYAVEHVCSTALPVRVGIAINNL